LHNQIPGELQIISEFRMELSIQMKLTDLVLITVNAPDGSKET